jgi:hypothetical protein
MGTMGWGNCAEHAETHWNWLYKISGAATLALVGVMLLGLYAVLRRTSRIWTIVAVIMPLARIGLFIVTNKTSYLFAKAPIWF